MQLAISHLLQIHNAEIFVLGLTVDLLDYLAITRAVGSLPGLQLRKTILAVYAGRRYIGGIAAHGNEFKRGVGLSARSRPEILTGYVHLMRSEFLCMRERLHEELACRVRRVPFLDSKLKVKFETLLVL